MRPHILIPLLLSFILTGHLCAQSLSMVSGNGQMVTEQFISNAPLIVQAKDAAGHPISGLAISFVITQGAAATLTSTSTATDASGRASTNYLASNIQPGLSFQSSTVTASTAIGNVDFIVTTVISKLANGGLAAPPLIQLAAPPPENRNLTAPSGSTLSGGVVVRVFAQSGFQQGSPVPNIAVRIANNLDNSFSSSAACRGALGVVLTDSSGTAKCDLVVSGPTGLASLTAVVGETQNTPPFSLQITPGSSCGYSLSAPSAAFASNGGAGTVGVFNNSGCNWSAASNANWVSITSGATGSGNGAVFFSVATNAGAARTGTLIVAGQTYSISQAAGNPSALAIATAPTLAQGNIASSYSVTLAATGGQPPYTWSEVGTLPPGLTLTPQGVLSGTPSTAGTYPFTATVTDNVGAQQSQNFSITINPASVGFTITNASFPNGVIGQAYEQLLTTSGGCVTPFAPSPAFNLSGGSLPNGINLVVNSDNSRSLTGTPISTGVFNFSLAASDACGHTASASFTITVGGTATPPQMIVGTPSLAFTVLAGGNSTPADQTVSISSSSSVLNYTAAIATTSGGSWLIAKSVTNGNTPGSITVGVVNFANLAPGQYGGTITITSQASNSPIVIPVSLTVLAAPTLTLSPSAFTVNQLGSSGATITRQVITVSSNSTPAHFTASATSVIGSWLSVSPQQGDTPGTVTAIINAAGLNVGTYTGTILITPTGGVAQSVTITLNVLPAATLAASPAPLTFTYQSGGTLPANQVLSLASPGASLVLTTAATTPSGNWLSVTQPVGATPTSVIVSVNPAGLAPGFYGGTITISSSDATVAILQVPVSLNITQPIPSIAAVTNAASFAPGPVAPGEFVVIFGTAMGPATLTKLQITDARRVPTFLADTQVLFDGVPAPMIYTSAGQVSAIVPYGVANGSTLVQVVYQNVRSNPFTVRVIDSAPGIFMADASGQGAIVNQDTSVNSVLNGADPGSVVSIYATGEGQTDPPGVDGTLGGTIVPLPRPRLPVTVQIAGQPTDVLYAGAAPGLPAGVMQVNARVPASVARGTVVSVVISVGVASSQAGVTLAIAR